MGHFEIYEIGLFVDITQSTLPMLTSRAVYLAFTGNKTSMCCTSERNLFGSESNNFFCRVAFIYNIIGTARCRDAVVGIANCLGRRLLSCCLFSIVAHVTLTHLSRKPLSLIYNGSSRKYAFFFSI